ncbi:MAG: Fic family protein [Ruminococcus sp.]|nr:Fic family protein [Ruminococcus sp.]
MENKYNMKKSDNIFAAKRLLVDAVYKSANLEGIAVTFAQTNDILNDVNVSSVKPSEISKVCCLRDAWKYVIDNIDEELTLGFIEEVHILVAKGELAHNELGTLRTDNVMISGTSWRPELPDMTKLFNEFTEIQEIDNTTDRALTTLLWIMKKQMFKDGNKRVATMICNKILIENGNGIMSVPVELDGMFKTLLVKYYETDDMTEIKQWVYDNCLDGI